jgi:CRISPR/Cas system CMR-associated protein Cmr3 (group 5 of RAMP superfamily)
MVQLNNITSLHNNCVHQRQRRSTRNSHVFIFLEKNKKKNNIENSIAHSEFFRCNDTPQQSINQRHGTGRYIQTLQLLADVSGSDA